MPVRRGYLKSRQGHNICGTIRLLCLDVACGQLRIGKLRQILRIFMRVMTASVCDNAAVRHKRTGHDTEEEKGGTRDRRI